MAPVIQLLFVCALMRRCFAAPPQIATQVDCSQPLSFAPFWKSTGYGPAEYFLRVDDVENVALMGSTPARAIEQLRMHYLLDLLSVTGFVPDSKQPSGYSLAYSWQQLDSVLDWAVNNRLSSGFEIMGSPTGFSRPSQWVLGGVALEQSQRSSSPDAGNVQDHGERRGSALHSALWTAGG
jgi:hypothetical protein